MVVYGYNHYARKTVSLADAGITETSDIKHFEFAQRYFHIFWIPVFPIGASWCARKKDGKLYKLENGPLMDSLKEVPYSRAGVLPAFIGLVLILIAVYFLYLRK